MSRQIVVSESTLETLRDSAANPRPPTEKLVEMFRTVPSLKAHTWVVEAELGGLEYCGLCGIVRRADDRNSPCRGPVRITAR